MRTAAILHTFRRGDRVCLPVFVEAVKAVTSGVTCLNCSHQHYSRLLVTPSSSEEEKAERSGLHEMIGDSGLKQPAESVEGIPVNVAAAV